MMMIRPHTTSCTRRCVNNSGGPSLPWQPLQQQSAAATFSEIERSDWIDCFQHRKQHPRFHILHAGRSLRWTLVNIQRFVTLLRWVCLPNYVEQETSHCSGTALAAKSNSNAAKHLLNSSSRRSVYTNHTCTHIRICMWTSMYACLRRAFNWEFSTCPTFRSRFDLES